QALLQLLVGATCEPRRQVRLLECAARLAELEGGAQVQGGAAEGLLHVALSLLEIWCDGAVDVGDSPPQLRRQPPPAAAAAGGAEAADSAATPADASAWHAAMGWALEASSSALAAAGLLAPFAERLCSVVLRACLASASASTQSPAAAAGGGVALPAAPPQPPPAHEAYLPRLHACLAACPHLLPLALERGLLGLLLRLPAVPPEAQRLGAAGGGSAAAAAGCRALCAQWLAQPA
ncbi:hypothetical protein Agub_g7707, partial [Astrephomene gubernaculifera]